MYLVIAEKPSVSRAIAEVIGAQEREDGYLRGTDCMVSWCFGHLVEYVSPDAYDEKFSQWRYEDLPIIPKDWKVTVSEDKKDQFYILKRLLNSPEIEYVVNACDAGREGELIFKHVYDLSGSKKPVKRLWISSLEDSAILDGMQHLRSAEEYRHLAEAAVCRSQADWLVGMNATRAYTTKYFKKLTVGRVQTPTLAMLVERAGQISNFQKEKYFNVELDCDGIPAVKPKIFDPDEAEQLRSRCQGSEAIVTAVKETEKKVKAPMRDTDVSFFLQDDIGDGIFRLIADGKMGSKLLPGDELSELTMKFEQRTAKLVVGHANRREKHWRTYPGTIGLGKGFLGSKPLGEEAPFVGCSIKIGNFVRR